jgi:hypothetical protein
MLSFQKERELAPECTTHIVVKIQTKEILTTGLEPDYIKGIAPR